MAFSWSAIAAKPPVEKPTNDVEYAPVPSCSSSSSLPSSSSAPEEIELLTSPAPSVSSSIPVDPNPFPIQQLVIDPSDPSLSTDLESSASSIPTKAKVAIVDTGALISGQRFEAIAPILYTVEEVLAEVRDKKSRDFLDLMGFKITVRDPAPEAYRFVAKFAKMTGDLPFLSVTDLKIMALTYQIFAERNGNTALRSTPKVIPTQPHAPSGTSPEASTSSEPLSETAQTTDISDEGSVQLSTDSTAPLTVESSPSSEPASSAEEPKSHQSSRRNPFSTGIPSMNGGWITPQNLEKVQQKDLTAFYGKQDEAVKVDVACFTRDFSMQNVLMQIGLPILSQEGLLIKHAKQWALRCYSCMRCERDTSRIFCRHCGNTTLVRVRMFVDAEGKVHFNKLWYTPTKRGTQFNIPINKGGRKGPTYVFAEDQLKPQYRRKQREENVFDPDYQFATSTTKKSHEKNFVIVGVGKKNPNRSQRRVNKKKKKQV